MTTDQQTDTTTLTFGQVAERLGVGVTTVRSWARTEQMPVIRDGRRKRVPASFCAELEARGWTTR